MKIAYVINNLSCGGAEKLVSDLAKLTKKTGNQVDILILNNNKSFFYEELVNYNINVINLNYRNSKNPLIIFKLIRLLKEYDIVHSHLYPTQLWIALAQLFIHNKKIKFITTEHSSNNRRRNKKIFRVLDSFMYKRYSKVIAISNDVKVSLENYLPKLKERIVQIDNGVSVNTNFINSDKEILEVFDNFPLDSKIILMVAGFRKQKDHKTVINATKFLPSNYKIVFIGEGEKLVEMKSYAKINTEYNNVFFVGQARNVGFFMKKSDVFVLSSFEEGFGLVLVEAMASGIPVIGSNVVGIREVVNESGLLFTRGDSNDLANKILEITNDPVQMNGLIRKGKATANYYSIEKMVNNYIHLYKSLS